MQALRLIREVAKDGYLHIKVPQEMGERVELIILPTDKDEESLHRMRLQEEGGFAKGVLAAANEDVWNDL